MPFFYDFENAAPEIRDDKARIAGNLIELRAFLNGQPPPRSLVDSLLIATWNIKWLGHYERQPESLWYIAEILSRFDIIAVQEVRADLTDLNRILALMGPWWKFVLTDVTEGDPGNEERLAIVYDSRKLRFGGLAGEIVLPAAEGETPRQFDRTPFVTGFHAGWFDFMLVTAHLHWGDGKEETPLRVAEAKRLGAFLKARMESAHKWAPHLILLGDFNVFNTESAVYKALTDNGFTFPHEGADLPPTNVGKKARFYDQIGYMFPAEARLGSPECGVLDMFEGVYRDDQLHQYLDTERMDGRTGEAARKYYDEHFRRNEMSDHLVLWTRLRIEFADAYLRATAGG